MPTDERLTFTVASRGEAELRDNFSDFYVPIAAARIGMPVFHVDAVNDPALFGECGCSEGDSLWLLSVRVPNTGRAAADSVFVDVDLGGDNASPCDPLESWRSIPSRGMATFAARFCDQDRTAVLESLTIERTVNGATRLEQEGYSLDPWPRSEGYIWVT